MKATASKSKTSSSPGGNRSTSLKQQSNSSNLKQSSNHTEPQHQRARKDSGNSIVVVEEATRVGKPDILGRMANQVETNGNTMVRRRLSDAKLREFSKQSGVPLEQLQRANDVGTSEVLRVIETAAAGAIIGASDGAIDKAIESELKSKGTRGPVDNEVFIDEIKQQYDLPDIRGGDVAGLTGVVAEMQMADMDPSSAKNWKNVMKFRRGKLTGRDVINQRVPANDSGGSPGPDGTGSHETPGDESADTGDVSGGGFDNPNDPQATPADGMADPIGNGTHSPNGPNDPMGNSDGGPGDGSGTGGGGASTTGRDQQADKSPPEGTSEGVSGEIVDDPNYNEAGSAEVTHTEDGYRVDSYNEFGEYEGSEQFTPDGKGGYVGDRGGNSNGNERPKEGSYSRTYDDNEGETTTFWAAEESDDEESEGDASSENSPADEGAGDRGYTPNDGDAMPTATAENLAQVEARQNWIDRGLKNPGNNLGDDGRDSGELITKSPMQSRRQQGAINPGPGGGQSPQPTVSDWTKRFGGIGLKDPPKPIAGTGTAPGPVPNGTQPGATVPTANQASSGR